jgi:hypothetical protein
MCGNPFRGVSVPNRYSSGRHGTETVQELQSFGSPAGQGMEPIDGAQSHRRMDL